MFLSQLIRKLKQRRYYTLRDFLALGYALVTDRMSGTIPRRLLLKNAVFTTVLDRKGTIRKNGKELEIYLANAQYILRDEGSDLAVFNQIVLNNELATVVSFAGKIKKTGMVIMDCGANIGLSALYFKQAFPDATVICVEPEESNFTQLCRNMVANVLTNMFTFQKGVWFEKADLFPKTDFRDGQNWSFSLQEQNTTAKPIEVDSIGNLIALAGVDHVDILKIDIEGAEHKLFEHLDRWADVLEQVSIVSVEIHEEVAPAWIVEERLLEAGFRIRKSGELVIGIRPQYV